MKTFKFLSKHNQEIENRMVEYENHLNEVEGNIINTLFNTHRRHPLREYDEIIIDMINYCGENGHRLTGYDRDVDNDNINVRVEHVNINLTNYTVVIDYTVLDRNIPDVRWYTLRLTYEEWCWRMRINR